MAILGKLAAYGAERIDLPDFLSMDAYNSGDFKYFIQSLIGKDTPYILKGFEVENPNTCFGSGLSVSISIANSIVYYPSSLVAPFYHGLEEGNTFAEPLTPTLRSTGNNYVYVTFNTSSTANDIRSFWDADKDGGAGAEYTQDVDTEGILTVSVGVSSSSFPEGTVPICLIVTSRDSIVSIKDCRNMLFRLGSGGINPDPFNKYSFKNLPNASFAREENNDTITNTNVGTVINPFQGGDKNISTLKEWMDAVMTKFCEIGDTNFWYQSSTTNNTSNLFLDTLSTSLKSKGEWFSSTTNQGRIGWTEDIHIKYMSDPRDIVVSAFTGNTLDLSDNDVMYIELERGLDINGTGTTVTWTNGSNSVTGTNGAFDNISVGDWIKKKIDKNDKYVRVDVIVVGSFTTLTLNTNYLGTTSSELGVYTKGVYDPSTDISIESRGSSLIQELGQNLFWLANRSDARAGVSSISASGPLSITIRQIDSKTARCESTGHGLTDGYYLYIDCPTYADYTGTFQIKVEDANNFSIICNTTSSSSQAANGTYYICTTNSIDSNTFEVESANHCFSDEGLVYFDDDDGVNSYRIKVIDDTRFQFASTISHGTATLCYQVKVNIRLEFGAAKIIQGEIRKIGDAETKNILNYIGMPSVSVEQPVYDIPDSINGCIIGAENYGNPAEDDDLTERVSRLTAMMADKAQDRMIKISHMLSSSNPNIYLTNTVSGAGCLLAFNATSISVGFVTITVPGLGNFSWSPSNTLLAVNQIAYLTIDRNNTSTSVVKTISNISSFQLNENSFILAYRLSSTDIFLYDGRVITPNAKIPLDEHNYSSQNTNIDLTNGGFWSWNSSTNTLSWTEDAYLQVPGVTLPFVIAAGSTVLAGTKIIAGLILDRTNNAGPTLTLTTYASWDLIPKSNDFIMIAYKDTSDEVVVGVRGEMRLLDGESKKLYRNTGKVTENWVQVNLYDAASTSLPAVGSSPTIDGVVVANGDLVLFGSLSAPLENNKIYLANIAAGVIVSWVEQALYNGGSSSPSTGDSVIVKEGSKFNNQIGIFKVNSVYVSGQWTFNDNVRYFNGENYYEQSSLNISTIANNTTDNITTYAVLNSEYAEMTYSIKRGTIRETGKLLITTDGTTINTALANINANTGSTGITFSADISGLNIRIRATTDNSGSAAEIKFFLIRWSDAAGGPAGVATYTGSTAGFISGSGTSTQLAIFNGATSVTSNANFTVDTVNGLLKLGSADILEISKLNSVSLIDGTYNLTYPLSYKSCIIEYSAETAAGIMTGRLIISNNATLVNLTNDYSEVGAAGVTIVATIVGADIQLAITSGAVGTFKYAFRRW